MRSLVLILVSFFSLVSAAEIKLPSLIKNPFATSITAAFLGPQKDTFKRDSVVVLPNRNDVFLMEDLAQLRFTYRLQDDRRAPLMFIVPGTGGNSEAGGALLLAEQYYKMGYQTVTLENPYYWGFAVSSSTRGLPGYTPDDAADLYRGMQKITRQLKNDRNVKPRSFSVSGYSLGALQTLFLNKIDQESQQFNFAKILLINPPANLLHSVTKIDRLYAQGDVMGKRKVKELNFRILGVASQYMDAGLNYRSAQFIQQVYGELKLTDQEMAYLIGTSFRESIRDVVFASQQVNDLGVLKVRATRYRQNDRWDEAMKVSFTTYISEFLYPQIAKDRGAGYTIEDMNAESSIYQFADMIKSNSNIYLFTSEDDLIVEPQDVAWFKAQFGNRALVLPYGGHCGGMNFPEFKQNLKAIFSLSRSPAPTPASTATAK